MREFGVDPVMVPASVNELGLGGRLTRGTRRDIFALKGAIWHCASPEVLCGKTNSDSASAIIVTGTVCVSVAILTDRHGSMTVENLKNDSL